MNDIFFKDLIGKNCLITGGYGTIGKSLAKGLASIGANIAILGRNKEKAEKFSSDLINEYNIRSIGVKADVINKETLISAKNEINDKLGKINILINCAGGNLPEATTKIAFFDNNMDISLSIFGLNIKCMYDVFDLNFMGTLLPIIIFGKDFIELQKGVILNVSSISSFRPLTKIPAYSAAKASVNNLTQYLAVHFSKANIRVNAIAPGFF